MPRLMDIKKLMEYLSLGKGSAKDVGAKADAVIRIGRRVVYDRMKIDAYIDSLGGGGEVVAGDAGQPV